MAFARLTRLPRSCMMAAKAILLHLGLYRSISHPEKNRAFFLDIVHEWPETNNTNLNPIPPTVKRFVGAYRHWARFKGFKDLHSHHMAIEVARRKLLLVWLYPTVGQALVLLWSMFQFNTFSESNFIWHFLIGQFLSFW